jgi:Fe(3+) dicitrate transport protein
MASAMSLAATSALAQSAAEPAGEGALPEVEVIQKKAAPQAAAKKKSAPVQTSSPTPMPPPAAEVAAEEPALENSPYGAAASAGAAARAAHSALSPINAKAVLPDDLQDFAGSASRVTSQDIDEQRPLTNHEALARVPGVVTVNDDGFSRHSGIGVRGSPFRRSRKVLIMEDGVPINFSTYLDSSTHYTPPIERIESIEVMRGPIVNYGPLNNHGVINFRNLSPFGANETVIKAGIGYTEGSDRDLNNFRHVHTRQNLGNVGIVASYSGADAGGAWDTEELGYNDFYGAIGFRGTNQDLTISGGYFRQRDVYDEDNFDEDEQAEFFKYGRNKTRGAADGFFAAPCCYDLSEYGADYYRVQVAHNLYIDKNTTLSTRIYGNDHDRARFYAAEVDPPDVPDYTRANIFMEGRDRLYQNYGADSRMEIANLPLFGGMKHDLQFGVKYEEHFFKNQNRVNFDGGVTTGEILDFDNRGLRDGRADKLEAQSFAAFVQSAVHITPTFTVTPGVRLESYEIEFDSEDYVGSADYDHVLPMLAFAWEAAPRTTLYGGYHRGLTPHIIRDSLDDADDFVAPEEEIGDNFEVGVRTTAIRGVTLDMAYFHNRIDHYQFGESFQDPSGGDRVFSSLDEVTINGFEIYSRIDSNPFTGGPWNVFGEAVYTYADSEIDKGIDDDGNNVAGKRVPESIRHFANLTLGVQHKIGWDASVTWTHRGEYHTDAINSSYEDGGLVPDVWLLSARSNLKVTDQLSLFLSGQNLTDEFYINDRNDGMKPGVGRTVMGGFTLKFD